jgi:hypothetical protein
LSIFTEAALKRITAARDAVAAVAPEVTPAVVG